MNLINGLLAASANYNGASMFTATNVANVTMPFTNVTAPSAPLYNNVSVGVAWVFPASTHDIGARGMRCECFDPDLSCCMPTAASNAPFCIPQNATCCSNTYCDVGTTCCGEACCAADLTCSFTANSPTCCPRDQLCTGPAICFDHSSPNCKNPFSAATQCCPKNLPYCRFFEPYGIGCYASASANASSTSVTFPLQGPDEGHRTSLSPLPRNTSYASTTTESVAIIPLSSGAFSLAFPTVPPGASATASLPVSTSVVLVMSSPTNRNSTHTSHSSTNSSTSAAAVASGSDGGSDTVKNSTSRHRTSTTTTEFASRSALCFNQDIQAPAPCSSTSSADDGGFPGASTVGSGASAPDRAMVLLLVLSLGLVVGL